MLLLSTEGRAEVKRSIKTSFEREAFLITFDSRKETFFFLASATEFIVFWGRYFSKEREGRIEADREKMKKAHRGKELVTESPIHARAHVLFPSFASRTPPNPRVLLCFAPMSRWRARARMCACACVCTFLARVRVSQPRQPVETRATIFEPRKERSRMNFLHNFGSPRRF